ncbi:MAG TPA: DoxX family protein, partial [Terriglobales bacterium]|nr:DoxX family protein [Terriglobales bacterium]
FFYNGVSELVGRGMAGGFPRFGYPGFPGWLLFLIGLIEIAGAIGMLIPKRAAEAASFLIVVMLGALIMHIRSDEHAFVWPLLVLLMLGGLVSLRAEEAKES